MKNLPQNQILKMLDLSAFSPEEQEEMLLTLSDLVFRGSLVRLIEKMDDNTRDEFTALTTKAASGDEVVAFLKERVPGADDTVRETIEDIANDMAALNIPAAA